MPLNLYVVKEGHNCNVFITNQSSLQAVRQEFAEDRLPNDAYLTFMSFGKRDAEAVDVLHALLSLHAGDEDSLAYAFEKILTQVFQAGIELERTRIVKRLTD